MVKSEERTNDPVGTCVWALKGVTQVVRGECGALGRNLPRHLFSVVQVERKLSDVLAEYVLVGNTKSNQLWT